MYIQTMSAVRKDFVVSHIKTQLSTLRHLLGIIESGENADKEYTSESLKQVEHNLRKIRKLCENN